MLRRILAVAVLLAGPAAAEGVPPGLAAGETAVAAEALDGDTLRLRDGRDLRLADIGAPKPLLPRAGSAPTPDRRLEALTAAARRSLDKQARDRPIDIYPVAPLGDRHGRIVAHVVIPGGGWLQAQLLAEGLARVQPASGAATGIETLLRIEAAARAARRGLWAHPLFQIRTPEEASRWLDTFQLVEGPITSVRNGRTSTRIEIGDGERRLAVIVASKIRSALRAAGIDVAQLSGRRARVRGWLRWQDGARLDLAHPAALELLAP